VKQQKWDFHTGGVVKMQTFILMFRTSAPVFAVGVILAFLAGFFLHMFIAGRRRGKAEPASQPKPVHMPQPDDDEKTVNPYTFSPAENDDDEKTVNPYGYTGSDMSDGEETVNPYEHVQARTEDGTVDPYAGHAYSAMFDDDEEETVNPYAAGWATVATVQLSYYTADGLQRKEISFDKNLLIGGQEDALDLPQDSILDCQLMLIRRSGITYVVKTSGYNQQAVPLLNGVPLSETLMPIMEGDVLQLHQCTINVDSIHNCKNEVIHDGKHRTNCGR